MKATVPKVSAGLLMYRRAANGELEFLIAHPGGPIFARKDTGAWTIPKGLVDAGEEPLATAQREFEEETGFGVGDVEFVALGSVRQKSGKVVHAWAFEGDCDPAALSSNTFEMQWPPRSGRWQSFPEVDRAMFASAEVAKQKLNPAQAAFIDRALAAV